MPNTITFEREKLNQAMYQKLKRFIMNKRKREAEERAQADYYKRLKKEREERKKLIKFSTESLENAKREISETKKRISLLKTEKDALFTRFKQITQECKLREAEIRTRNQQVQMDKAVFYADQFQSRASHEALFMLSKVPHKEFTSGCSSDASSQANNLRKQVGQLYCQSQFSSPSSLTHGAHDSSTTFSEIDKLQMTAYGPLIPQQHQLASKSLLDVPISNALGNRELTAQDFQTISKYLADFGAVSGKIPSEILNKLSTGTLSAFLNNPKFVAMAAASSLNTTVRSPSTSSLPTSVGVSSASAATSLCVGGGGTFLPPAPTGYRGSITTGQSAQQIQLAQQLSAQQQVAALFTGHASSQSHALPKQ